MADEVTINDIQQLLKERGYREASHRTDVLHVLDRAEKPLTGVEIINRVAKRQHRTKSDKAVETTIYRNIDLLAKEGFVKVISLLDGHSRYELERGDHHHHLVCTECEEILPVHMQGGDHLEETESELEREHKFKITSHSLEFFGVCADCQVNP